MKNGYFKGGTMKKTLLKKLLYELDYIELQGISLEIATNLLSKHFQEEDDSFSMQDIFLTLSYLRDISMIKESNKGIDLCPAATIFAKSKHLSTLEALAYFESMLQDQKYQQIWKSFLLSSTPSLCIPQKSFHPFDEAILQQTLLFQNQQNKTINADLTVLMKQILQEYLEEPTLISKTLGAFYAKTLLSYDTHTKEYKNIDKEMIPYEHLNHILDILPEKGIPVERNDTRHIQSFYKDTLFHEYNHTCALCQIAFPPLLVASHIKPFRDCAHIFEAIDYHNGLLLCKNHDLLFDQGYISFHTDGTLLISDELQQKLHNMPSYLLHSNFKLPKQYLTKERLKFLQYHQQYIYKGNHS